MAAARPPSERTRESEFEAALLATAGEGNSLVHNRQAGFGERLVDKS